MRAARHQRLNELTALTLTALIYILDELIQLVIKRKKGEKKCPWKMLELNVCTVWLISFHLCSLTTIRWISHYYMWRRLSLWYRTASFFSSCSYYCNECNVFTVSTLQLCIPSKVRTVKTILVVSGANLQVELSSILALVWHLLRFTSFSKYVCWSEQFH